MDSFKYCSDSQERLVQLLLLQSETAYRSIQLKLTLAVVSYSDTTVSMSSAKKGVQAELAKYAPRQSIKVAADRSTLLYAMLAKYIQFRTLMDSCHQLFSFSVNSPKQQKFLTTVIDVIFPDTKRRKLKDLRFVRDEVDQEALHI